jgi:hypothetical protein
LSEIEPEELILCQREDIQASGFQIGIRTEEDGFVETICSKELLSGMTLEVG